jgi:hypothetical protein
MSKGGILENMSPGDEVGVFMFEGGWLRCMYLVMMYLLVSSMFCAEDAFSMGVAVILLGELG